MQSQHSFGSAPSVDVPRSTFNLSHGHKTTFDADYLVPVLVQEVLPGDSFNCRGSYFARVATPIFPILDNLYLDWFYFFVAYRQIWDDPTGGSWTKFCGAQEDPADTIDYTVPKLDSNASYDVITGNKVLFDYMGLPWVNSLDLTEISALPFRAYNKIYSDWFRDQNLIDSPDLQKGDGPDSQLYYDLLKRCKKRDYFTSSLPWPQKTAGTAEISLPLGTDAPVTGIGVPTSAGWTTGAVQVYESGQPGFTTYNSTRQFSTQTNVLEGDQGTPIEKPNIYADLSSATSATINELRQAFQLQRLLERDARSGTRYVEHLKAHWKVNFPDYTAQRAEFLGGGSSRVTVSQTPNTADAPGVGSDLGKLGAYGTAGGQAGFTKSFVEHGVIIGLVNARADISYQQGLERFWTRDTRYDYFLPVLSGLGEMAVLNREIYYTNTSTDEDVWGYQESWADYRYRPSRLSGLFRSTHASSLDVWHLSEEFTSLPTLGQTFIEANTAVPLDRAIAVPSEPHFLLDCFFDIKAARAMPIHGVPGNLDHF